ncbi:MAG: hypothetical protein ACRDRG_16615 [Pseudonocardiaceae bacterium]
MTSPTRSSDGAFLTVRFEPSMDAWSFAGAAAGPAGTVSVLLDDDVRFSVDAADLTRIIEVAVRNELAGRPAPAAVELTRSLLGAAAAEFLIAADTSRCIGVRIEIGGDTAIRSSAAALAVALAATSQRPLAHRLRGLDVVLHSNRIGHSSSASDATRASWAVWPAAVALARACTSYPSMLTAVPAHSLAELRSRLLVLLSVVEQDDPSVVHSAAHRLVADLVERTAAEQPDTLTHVDVDATLAALEFAAQDYDDYPMVDLDLDIDKERVYKGSAVAPRPIRWKGSVQDFASRLGAELQLLHPGRIIASGQAPGELTVTMPVALGVRTADLRNVRVRAVTDTGHLLGDSALAVRRDPQSLPVGVAQLVLPETAEGRRYERVIIDLAHHVIAVPDTTDIERLDRLRAIRAGQEAVACAAAGDYRASAQLWRECTDQLNGIGEHELRDQAREHAERAEAQAEADPADRADAEWLTAVLTAWSNWALTEVDRIETAAQRGPVEGPIDELRELIDRLVGWNDPSAELARARAQLGRALRAAPEHTEEPDEAEYQLREAMRIFYDLGDDVEALACLRELGSRTTRG